MLSPSLLSYIRIAPLLLQLGLDEDLSGFKSDKSGTILRASSSGSPEPMSPPNDSLTASSTSESSASRGSSTSVSPPKTVLVEHFDVDGKTKAAPTIPVEHVTADPPPTARTPGAASREQSVTPTVVDGGSVAGSSGQSSASNASKVIVDMCAALSGRFSTSFKFNLCKKTLN